MDAQIILRTGCRLAW